jgi:thioredoxin-related protein
VKADWCGYCHQLLEQTLADSTVMGLISNNFNLCIIDGDSRDTLRCEGNLCTYHQYVRDILKVKGYPTSIFFDSAGNEIARAPGYLDASAYAYLLREVYNRM